MDSAAAGDVSGPRQPSTLFGLGWRSIAGVVVLTLALIGAGIGIGAAVWSGSSPGTAVSPATNAAPSEPVASGNANPCNTFYFGPAACQNVQGAQWKADNFWASHTWQVHCPPNWSPINKLPLVFGGAPSHGFITTSKHFTSGAGFLPEAVGANITVTDYNISGHPVAYVPVLACCKPDDPADGHACSGYG
jgi:hypothetical protein